MDTTKAKIRSIQVSFLMAFIQIRPFINKFCCLIPTGWECTLRFHLYPIILFCVCQHEILKTKANKNDALYILHNSCVMAKRQTAQKFLEHLYGSRTVRYAEGCRPFCALTMKSEKIKGAACEINTKNPIFRIDRTGLGLYNEYDHGRRRLPCPKHGKRLRW